MPQRTAVLNIVGLTRSLLGEHAPTLTSFAHDGTSCTLEPVLPAVTCSVQSSMLTGVAPEQHGIVGNGWYDRESAEVRFWKQSNHLVHAENVWETARTRDPSVTTAVMFWWYNMYSSAEYSVTPRPIYCADGRKIPDVYTEPADLRDRLQAELGRFPLFSFWGPASSIRSSEWIAEASKHVFEWHDPTLSLVYLPHLDYSLQKLGPEHPAIVDEVRRVDDVARGLIDFYHERGVRVIVCSEYGIVPVSRDVAINRDLRRAGFVHVREEQGGELLDAGASRAFAVADHQVAHVYVKSADDLPAARDVCENTDGVEAALDRSQQAAHGVDHERAGELVLVAAPDRWFSYPYWLDDDRAPDFARTVDIHRKPGYDPCELFLDPAISFPKIAVVSRLLRRKIGMRTLMDVVPLDGSLVQGSHGRTDNPADRQPVLLCDRPNAAVTADAMPCAALRDVMLASLFDD